MPEKVIQAAKDMVSFSLVDSPSGVSAVVVLGEVESSHKTIDLYQLA